MDFDFNVQKIEEAYRHELLTYLNQLFTGVNLPSHDISHHERVWRYCRSLLLEINRFGLDVPADLVENAIVACYFHDTGLTINLGESHGALGAEICSRYLQQKPNFTSFRNKEILTAIEFHDDKSIRTEENGDALSMLNLTRLVSTADDLDAFGTIGVFRYIEIYLKRAVAANELPGRVLTNLQNRYSNFKSAYALLEKFVDRQECRYYQTFNFFTRLATEVTLGVGSANGPYGVYRVIENNLVEKGQSIEDVIDYVNENPISEYAQSFFNVLKVELNINSTVS